MSEIKMLMIEDLTTGQRTNFSPMSVEKSMEYIKNQESVNECINNLFDNVSASDRFVFNESSTLNNNHQIMQLSAIQTGLVNIAMQSPEFADYGSDYVRLSIIKKAYDKFDDDLVLSTEANELLDKYKLKPAQLNAFDSDELLDSLKYNQKENRSVNYLTEKTNTFVLHALPNFMPTANSPVDGQLSRKQKVELLRSTSPEICCSTFKNGVAHEGYDFGGGQIGVILSGGVVTQAGSTDLGSTVGSNGNRVVISEMNRSQQDIENVFNERVGDTSYNEVIVKDAKVAGVYINLDARSDAHKGKTLAESLNPEQVLEIFGTLKAMSKDDQKSLPILAIHKGELKEITLNVHSLKEYLPEAIAKDIKNFNPHTYDERLSSSDETKRAAWRKLSDDSFMFKSFEAGSALSQRDIHNMGHEHDLTNSRKIELLDKNEKSLKGDIIANKLLELRDNHLNTELNMNLSVFENINYQKSNSYIPSYSHKFKSSQKMI